MDVRLIDAEVLRVGPDETLIVKVPEEMYGFIPKLLDAFKGVGLAERVLVVSSDDIEFAVASRAA